MKLNNINVNNTALSRRAANNTSFKGVWNHIGTVNKNLMERIEKGGFFAEFCIMDMCGLVLPRVYQGFQRNKEELGHLNYQAGAEEFLREFITGPSLFLIPIGAVVLAGRLLGKATQINSKLLTQFSDTFKSMDEKHATFDVEKTRKSFASKLFDKFIAGGEGRKALPKGTDVKELEAYKLDFVKQITANLDTKLKIKDKGLAIKGFEELIANINTSHFARENTLAISVGKEKDAIHTTARDLFLDARKYMEDVIPSAKATFDDLFAKGKELSKNLFDETITKITDVRRNGRKLLCLGGSAALAGFLCVIPKLYQLSKKNPALNGIENHGGDK